MRLGGLFQFRYTANIRDDDNGDDNGDDEPTTAATSAPPTQAAEPTEDSEPTTAATEPTGGSETQTIVAADFSFSPSATEASVGVPTTFILENSGQAPHTLTIFSDEGFTTAVPGADTGNVAGGAEGEFEVTFDEAGPYYFRCNVHPSLMEGEITVS